MAPPAPALLEELVEEVLLRFPPDEPESLFRASLVCKPWCRLISGPRFRRRYREFHRTPPILGFLCGGRPPRGGVEITRFVPTSTFCSPLAERRCQLLDARHGRVLLLPDLLSGRTMVFLVWDPITDVHREIPLPKMTGTGCSWKGAVVCAAAAGGACDHLDCHRGAFLVVFVVACTSETFVWTYSSVAGSWSDPISTQYNYQSVGFCFPSVLVGNALYFDFGSVKTVFKYDLEFHELSVVGLPPRKSFFWKSVMLRSTEDGWLGLATIAESKLYTWSRKHGPEAEAVWTCDRVIELETLFCSNANLTQPVLRGFVERSSLIVLREGDALFTFDLKTSKVKKVCDGGRCINTVVPYSSFCTPALGGGLRGEGPSA